MTTDKNEIYPGFNYKIHGRGTGKKEEEEGTKKGRRKEQGRRG